MENDEELPSDAFKIKIIGWAGFIIFCCILLVYCTDENKKEVSLEAIKKGLHQDSEGHWVK